MTRRIRLRGVREGADFRCLDAYINADGDLVIEGSDMGPGVEEYWGRDEYEWVRVIGATHISALLVALGATKDDDILTVLDSMPKPRVSYRLEELLRDEVVPSTISTWL